MADTPNDGDLPGGDRTEPREVVVAGAGERARAWLGPLRRARRLRAVATVARGDEPAAADLPHYASLDDALCAHPSAAFALALPSRAALAGALQIAAAGRAGVVEAPLHDAVADADLGPGAAEVRVAHGWVTLPGLRVIGAVMRRAGGGRLGIEVAGLPEEEGGDPLEVLVHALALVRTLLPQAVLSAARHLDGGAIEVGLTAPSPTGEWAATLRAATRGRRLALRVEGGAETAVWTWDRDRESVRLGDRPLIAPRATAPAAVRALAQLLPDAPQGDGLAEAAAVARLARAAVARLPTRLPLGARALRQSAAVARRRPSDLLARLGLCGALASDDAPEPPVLGLSLPAEPFELWAFRAGVKPVAFLTVRPTDVEPTLACFGDVYHERRERRVRVEAQDHWHDRRDEGAPHVELYIARDAALARRVARLQAEVDPTSALREIGALVGYPPCCVEAFARQDDRANNSGNRYQSYARTCSPGAQGPWPWELNNLHTMIVPFYPCSYRCERALAWARAALAEMARAHPAVIDSLRAALARPVLYFDHDHQLTLDGECVGDHVRYRGVALNGAASPEFTRLAAAIGRGTHLTLNDRELLVDRDGRTVLHLMRTDPALGFVAPFGSGTAARG